MYLSLTLLAAAILWGTVAGTTLCIVITAYLRMLKLCPVMLQKSFTELDVLTSSTYFLSIL